MEAKNRSCKDCFTAVEAKWTFLLRSRGWTEGKADRGHLWRPSGQAGIFWVWQEGYWSQNNGRTASRGAGQRYGPGQAHGKTSSLFTWGSSWTLFIDSKNRFWAMFYVLFFVLLQIFAGVTSVGLHDNGVQAAYRCRSFRWEFQTFPYTPWS